ncbi:MAG: trypsin-like peptidase domain-containing protein [Planctomycetota bacterium]|nr:trypsin-like peptidase domain-containing protein [Planctomycetota bacterium]
MRLIKTSAFFVSAILAFAGCSSTGRGPDPQTPAPMDFIRVIQDAKAKVFPVIVYIMPIQETYEAGKKLKQQVIGSGAIISPDGYVVTNHHVAEKSTQIKCVLADQREVKARIVGLDQDCDLALLKLELPPDSPPLQFAVFGDSRSLQEGDFVMTMGCPLGLTRSISFGIISNTKQYLEEWSKYNVWLQTDAAINPGNSGGPLVNVRGEIVGINTLGSFWAENIGFAIPSDIVKEVIEQLMKNGKVERVWTGLHFQALKDFIRSTYVDADKGAMIASIDEGSPAEAAGIRAGDLVLACNGKEVVGTFVEDMPDVRRVFAGLPKDVDAELLIRRGNEEMVLKIKPCLKGRVEGEDFDCEEWMMTVKEINKFRDEELYYFRKKGIFIQGIKYPGNAMMGGFGEGDIVVKIGDKEITGIADAKEVYANLDKLETGKRKVLFELLRGGKPQFLVLDFEKRKSVYEEEE